MKNAYHKAVFFLTGVLLGGTMLLVYPAAAQVIPDAPVNRGTATPSYTPSPAAPRSTPLPRRTPSGGSGRLSQAYLSPDGSWAFLYPEGWTLQGDDDLPIIEEPDSATVMIFFGPDFIEDLAGPDTTASDVATAIGGEFMGSPGTFDPEIAAQFDAGTVVLQLQETDDTFVLASVVVVPFVSGEYGAILIFPALNEEPDVIPEIAAIAATFNSANTLAGNTFHARPGATPPTLSRSYTAESGAYTLRVPDTWSIREDDIGSGIVTLIGESPGLLIGMIAPVPSLTDRSDNPVEAAQALANGIAALSDVIGPDAEVFALSEINREAAVTLDESGKVVLFTVQFDDGNYGALFVPNGIRRGISDYATLLAIAETFDRPID